MLLCKVSFLRTQGRSSSVVSFLPSALISTFSPCFDRKINNGNPKKIKEHQLPAPTIKGNSVMSGRGADLYLMRAQRWHLVDLKGHNVGRSAHIIAHYLMGKHKPSYHPSELSWGDHVVAINTSDVYFGGNKWQKKLYISHSGRPGGRKEIPAKVMHEKDPTFVIRKAVYNMLPRNNLRKYRMENLHLFGDDLHPYGPNISNIIKLPNIAILKHDYSKAGLTPGVQYTLDSERHRNLIFNYFGVKSIEELEALKEKKEKETAEKLKEYLAQRAVLVADNKNTAELDEKYRMKVEQVDNETHVVTWYPNKKGYVYER